MTREGKRVLRMGAEVFERAQGRSFAQNVTRTRRGEAALSYFTLSHYALHQVESVSAGPLGLCYRALPVCWTRNVFIRHVSVDTMDRSYSNDCFITRQLKSFFF